MQKVDFKKTLKSYWQAPVGDFVVVDVPPLPFLMVDGKGNPNNSPIYAEAVGALFAVSYKLKFISKAAGRDYVVAPLQGLWWSDDMSDFQTRKKENWSWTMMIMQPDWITPDQLDEAVAQVAAKGQEIPSTLRLEQFDEGQCVQTLHVGSYDSEAPTIRELHSEFLPANGLTENGQHHEIYVSDPRRTPTDKLKTILRQPVRARRPGEKTNWH